MKINIRKLIIMAILVFVCLLLWSVKSNAGSIGISSSATTVEPGKTYTVTVSGNNATGKVTLSVSNGTLSKSSVWLENSSEKVTVTAGAEGKVTVTATAVTIADSTTGEEFQSSKSSSVTVKKKEEQPSTPSTSNPSTNTPSTNKPATNNTGKSNTTNKTTKAETIQEEQEEASSKFGIESLLIKGILENDEVIELTLDKEFNIDVFDYICNVASNVKKLEIYKEAHEYNDLVKITGLEEDLKSGENIITLKMVKDGESERIYTIKVYKEEEVIQEANALVEQEVKQEIVVSIPLIWFVILEIAIVLATMTITVFGMRYMIRKKK